MVVSASASRQWSGVAVTSVPLATTVLALRAVKPASAALRGRSAAYVKGPAGSVPAEPVPLGFAVTAASVVSGASPAAGPVSAMGTRTSVTPTQAPAWAVGITQGVSAVKGALLVSMGTQGCHMGASAGLVPVLKDLGASDTLPLRVTVMATPSKWCATASQATQDYGASPAPLGTLGIHQGQAASANLVNAVGTLTPRTLVPVTLTRDNACAAYIIQRGHTVPTASLASTGRRPERVVTDVPATSLAQIPSIAHLLTDATVTQVQGNAHAFLMSRALAVTAVHPTSGTLPVAMAASPVPATQAEPEALPAMSSPGSATVMMALVDEPVLSARSSTGGTLDCSAVPVIVTTVE